MQETIKKILPLPIYRTLQKLYYSNIWFLFDIFETFFGYKDSLTPPQKIRLRIGPFLTAKRYQEIAEEYISFLKKYCKLKPDNSVLDVGCGCGHMTAPLTKFLSSKGKYEGFDVMKDAIAWSQQNISTQFPNFHFVHANVYNKLYNPRGKIKADKYKFPYKDKSFDVVFLASVFTHMLPEDIKHYLSGIKRILKPGGYCLTSYFLINEFSNRQLNEGKHVALHFPYQHNHYRTSSKIYDEGAVAFDEEYVRPLYSKTGFRIVEPIHYGSWSGRKEFLHEQDIIVARKI